MAFTFVQLDHFVAVAKLGSFSAAARARGVAQPAVSQSIAMLESDLGVRLFDRTSRRCTLTFAGNAFLGDAERITRELQDARDRVRRIGSKPLGRVVMGLTPGLNNMLAASLLACAAREHPSLDLIVIEGFVPRLRELLLDGRIDCALTYDVADNDKEVRVRPIAYEPMHLIAAPGVMRRSLGRGAIDIRQISRFALFLPTLSEEEGTGRMLMRSARDRGVTLDVRHQLQSASLIRRLLLKEELATVLPIGTVIDEVVSGELTARIVTEPGFVRSVHLAIPMHRHFGPAEKALEECIEEVARALLFAPGIWRHERDAKRAVDWEKYGRLAGGREQERRVSDSR
jgi:LysR family nitrogen assimilation transcriptional regulator